MRVSLVWAGFMGQSHLLVRFLKRLLTAWLGSSAGPDTSSPKSTGDSEPLSRFLTQRSQFALNRVKPGAFLPGRDRTTSVFRTAGLTDAAIWLIGQQHVAGPSNRRLYGRGDLRVRMVLRVGLRVTADDSPPRHAAIVGWPEEKDAQLSLAQQLATTATLQLCG